jgi:hypothetical protein
MSIVSIMAAILEDELREHGILELTRPDCETMVHSMIERTAKLEDHIKRHQLESYPSNRTRSREADTVAALRLM